MDEDDTIQCEHCEQHVASDETRTVYRDERMRGEETWCDDCVNEDSFYCNSCGEWFNEEHTERHHTPDGAVCETCRYEHYAECGECEDVYRQEDTSYNERRECPMCDNCYDSSGGEHIHSYHNGPSRDPLMLEDEYEKHGTWGGLMAGFELEVLGDSNDVVTAVKGLDDCERIVHIEEDSSVDYEIVSQPFTWGWYVKEGRQFMLDLTDELQHHGLRSWNRGRCGFHVHLSKQMFTRLQKVKLWRLIYDNMDHFSKLSGRGTMTNEYASFDVGDMSRQVAREGRLKCKDSDYRNNERYRAINFTNETIELRFMRGTLKHGLSNGAVEMAFALHEFTASHGISQMHWHDWSDWVLSNKKKYKWLDELMRVRSVPYDNVLCPGPFHCDKVRERAVNSAKEDPWVSEYKRTCKGDKLLVIDRIPEQFRKFHMVPEMEQYLHQEATFISHRQGSKVVVLQHEDGNIWHWPTEAVVRKGSGRPKTGELVMSYSRKQYEARIGFGSTLEDEAFSATARVINPCVPQYGDPDQIVVKRDGMRLIYPKSLFFSYREVKQYASN